MQHYKTQYVSGNAWSLVCGVLALAACVDRSEVLTIEQSTDNASQFSDTPDTQNAVTGSRTQAATEPPAQNTPGGTASASTENSANASQALLSNQTNGDSDASEPADAGALPFHDAGLVGNAGANADAAPTPGCRLSDGSFHAPGTTFTIGGGLSRCSCSEDQQLSCYPDLQAISCGAELGDTCGEALYCDYPISANCGTQGHSGYCKPFIQGCDGVFFPVCGCDGQTHGICDAHDLGISVAYLGECQ